MHLHGPGARPAPDPGARAPHHAAAVRARFDRVPLPRDAVLGAAHRDGLLVRASVRAAAGGGGGRGAGARAAALFLPRSDRLLRRADHHHGVRGRLRLLEVAAQHEVGHRLRRGLGHRARHQAQRLVHADLSRRALFVDEARRRPAPPPPAAHPAGVRVDGAAGAADLLRALALAVARAGGARADVLQPPPAARALQLRIPGHELEQPADGSRPQADPDDVPVRVDQPHGAGHDAGARDLGRGRAAAPPPRRRP